MFNENGYIDQNWSPGDVITATAMNDIEHGVADVVLIQDEDPTTEGGNTYQNGVYNKIWVQPEVTQIQIPTCEELYDTYPVKTASGNPAYFSDGANKVPVKELQVQINATPTSGSTPTLSGYTGITITRAKKNLLSMKLEDIKAANTSGGTWDGNVYTVSNVTHTVLTDADGNVTGIKVSGMPVGNRTLFKVCDFQPSFDMILNGCPAGGSDSTYELQYTIESPVAHDYGSGVNITGDGGKGRIYIIVRQGYIANDLLFTPMARLASIEDSTFEPCYGESYSVTFPTEAGTVYGGTLDATSGLLTVNAVFFETTWGEGQNKRFIGETITRKQYVLPQMYKSNVGSASAVCNLCPYDGSRPNDFEDPHFYLMAQQRGVEITPYAIVYLPNDTADNQVVQIAYRGTTFQTFQLDPIEVRTLLGENILYADCGEILVTYRMDPSLSTTSINNLLTSLSERLELWAETLQTYTDEVFAGSANTHYTDPIVPESGT